MNWVLQNSIIQLALKTVHAADEKVVLGPRLNT
jgi:hypothetical protein